MKRLDARQLNYFVVLAEERSFTRAAARLHVAQPSISVQIRKLEEFFGFALFLRSTRSVELTKEGQEILGSVAAVVDNSRKLREHASALRERNDLSCRLGATPFSVFVPERTQVVSAAAKDYPSLLLEVIGTPQPEQLDALLRMEIDAAFYMGHELQDSKLFERLVIRRVPFNLVVPVNSALAAKPSIALADLAQTPIAFFAREHGPVLFDQLTQWLVQDGGAQCIVPPESHPFALASFAAAQGICAISIDWFVRGDSLPDGHMVRPFAEPRVSAEMSLVRLAQMQRKRGLEQFWASAQHYVQAVQHP
ncbi:LysR family transcriptional regulator [Pseudomonas sp. PDM09]|uniref:LysR family transcriptional regulator n=1 Tax=Pseudomonas sp. PDM09 TaxID=2769270 RepID=UPI00177FED54|nr:LysR family transcriptional regulator [Pseudomonas sp. PDM09]MBD9562262.1 LysR family transcriptional regulator [Pseudomonas sp. PDM09]